jgi:predicted SPOUT superfamily RNA methylase MTH1
MKLSSGNYFSTPFFQLIHLFNEKREMKKEGFFTRTKLASEGRD